MRDMDLKIATALGNIIPEPEAEAEETQESEPETVTENVTRQRRTKK